MNSVRCPQCGFMTFATATECKRCQAILPSAGERVPAPVRAVRNPPDSDGSKSKIVGVVFLLIVCVLVAAGFKYRRALFQKFGGSLNYSELIRHSPEFNSAVWVRANQREIPLRRSVFGYGEAAHYINAGIIVREVEVLESLGLLAVTKYETSEAGEARAFLPRATYLATHYRINLTSLGEKEAGKWETFEEPYLKQGNEPAAQPQLWWRVPIGDREFGSVTKLGEVNKEGAWDTLDVEFSYKWRPNNIGLAFDKATPADAIPTNARKAAEILSWDSRKLYLAVAHMEKIGGEWKLASVTFTNEDNIRNSITYAVY